MKKHLCSILLLILLAGCQAGPIATPTAAASSTPAPTQTPSPTSTATASPTPTVVPTPTTSPQILEQQAATLCEQAFSASISPGEFKMPYLGMWKTEVTGTPAWNRSNSIPHLFSLSAESVQSIICMQETKHQVGIYTDGSAAFKLRMNIRVLSWPDGTVVASQINESGMPPKTKTGFSGGYGSYPEGKSVTEWILGQVEHSEFLYFPRQNLLTVAISPGNNLGAAAISADDVSKILLFDWTSMAPVVTLENGDLGGVNNLVFSPDGNVLVSAGVDHIIRFWEVQTRQQVHELKLQDLPTKMLYSPNGEYIVVTSSSVTYVIESDTREIKFSLSGTAHPADLGFSADSRRIFINGPLNDEMGITNGINVVDVETGRPVSVIPDMSAAAISISPEGQISFEVPFPAGIGSFIVSPDGSQVISFDSTESMDHDPVTGLPREGEHSFGLWDAASGQYLFDVIYTGMPVRAVEFSPDGAILATGNEAELWIWDTRSWTVIRKFVGHTGKITDLAFTPDGKHILTTNTDGTLRTWSLKD